MSQLSTAWCLDLPYIMARLSRKCDYAYCCTMNNYQVIVVYELPGTNGQAMWEITNLYLLHYLKNCRVVFRQQTTEGKTGFISVRLRDIILSVYFHVERICVILQSLPVQHVFLTLHLLRKIRQRTAMIPLSAHDDNHLFVPLPVFEAP